jgi:hypothetical protein
MTGDDPCATRRFPPPWTLDEYNNACFIVKDATGQKLAYLYFEDEPGRRSAARLLTKDEARRITANIAELPEMLTRTARFDFARTTTNIAAASASSAASFAVADWNTYDGFFASATTCKTGSRSLAVAFRTQCFWHFARLPSLQHINNITNSPRC